MGLEIVKSVTMQIVASAVKATDGGEWVQWRCSRSHHATVAVDGFDYCLVEGVTHSTWL
jgi:hypothetical protein